MPVYDLKCRDCGCLFTLPNVTEEEFRECMCLECQGTNLQVEGYCKEDVDIVAILLERMSQLETDMEGVKKDSKSTKRAVKKLIKGQFDDKGTLS